MDIKKLSKKVKGFLKKNKKPIVSVIFLSYERGKRRIRKYCGISTWLEHDGVLWLESISKGSRDEKHSVRMPVSIGANHIRSVKMLNIQDLIDNTNILYRINEEMESKKREMN